MRFAFHRSQLTVLLICIFLASTSAFAEKKLKGFYGGSGGITPDVYRLVMVEFAEDGTAIVQQNWHAKDPQVWHTHWTQNGKQVKIVFDPVKNGDTPKPLLLDFKHGTLTPTDWDVTALGVGGPPKLTPFGGKNPKPVTATPCVSMNSRDPSSQNCPTWDSRR
jgi:hypothetical protein